MVFHQPKMSIISSYPAPAEYLKKEEDGLAVVLFWWELRESNPRPSACKADALNQLS